jgi:hypothetical protein
MVIMKISFELRQILIFPPLILLHLVNYIYVRYNFFSFLMHYLNKKIFIPNPRPWWLLLDTVKCGEIKNRIAESQSLHY